MSLRSSATILIVLGLLVCGLGLYAAREATSFIPSLNLARPPLADAEIGVSSPSRRLTGRVVLIIVDGLRLDASRTMSTLNQLRAVGVDAEASSHYPSMSRPNYVSIVAGVPPQWSGVRSNDYDLPVPLDSAPKRAKQAGLGVSFVSQIATGPRVMFGAHVDHSPVVPREADLETAILTSLDGPDDLVAVLIGAVDIAGHAHGGASDEYADAVGRVNAMLERVLRKVDLQRDSVIVVADHGHIDDGGHGGLEPEVMTVPLILAGAGFRAGAPLVRAQIIDVAPTICALLGIPMPRHALGLAMIDSLAIGIVERDAIRHADITRIKAINQVTSAVQRRSEEESWSTRLQRGGASMLVLATLITLTVWAARRAHVLIDLRVLLVAVPAFPLTFYAMVLSLEHMLTPSMVPPAGTLATQLFKYGMVAAAVYVVIGWIMVAHRARASDRVAAAAGLVLVGTIVMLVPAALMWVITGPPFTAAVPRPDVLMLPPTTYAAVACYSLGSVAFVAFEYIAYVRRSRPSSLAPA
ncbi:MAG: alkaline phosphatase family protein [Deltaproteobacteria bacterium]|nr:alkaline phosphatase family protein [Deltaproteobacteria bacterium]MDQ3295628.1 alkaline phosphatase family protein [Myxococcota bacterium]